MVLYSSPDCVYCHCVRFVLQEKAVAASIENINSTSPSEELIDINPYGEAPTLVDRELVLYDARIIMEYLDERFPHPPLHAIDPAARARTRLFMHRIEKDWYSLYNELLYAGEKKSARLKKLLRERLLSGTPVFAAKPYFMSDEFSLVDCTIAPLLWRLPSIGIDIPLQAVPLVEYTRRVFSRQGFQASLSSQERNLALFV